MGRSVVVHGNEAVKRLKKGLDDAVATVAATFGPRGRCVIVAGEADGAPVVTKDGVTVSRAIDPVDPVERMGARLVREAASRTNDEAGDGTTTASVLVGSLVSSVVRFSAGGFDRVELKRGLDDAVALVLGRLASGAIRVDSEDALRNIAVISANGDAVIGSLVAQAVHRTGADGVVSVEDSRSSETSLEIVDGLRFERGYLSPYFVTDQERMRVVHDDAAVLVTDRKLSSLKELVPLLEDCNRSQVPLLIVAEDVDGDAIQGLVLNRVTGGLRVAAVKLPGYGSDRDAQLLDLVALVGGDQPTVASGKRVDSLRLKDLGRVKRISVDARSTTIVGRPDAQDRVKSRVEELRSQLEDVALSKEEVDQLRRRMAKLSSGAAIVRVGGATEIELVERRYRIEDAIHAAKAALEEGVVLGGGQALLDVKLGLERDGEVAAVLAKGGAYAAGFRAVLIACEAPLRTMVKNAGGSADVAVDRCARSAPCHGWDVSRGDVVDLREAGILDPAKVTRCALSNAASVAGVFLQVEAVVHEPPTSAANASGEGE